MCIPKKPIMGKKICQPFSALLRPALRRLRQYGPSMFYYQATNFLGPKHNPAFVASYTPILAAWRRFAEAYPVPSLLLAALQSSLIILLQVPLKNSPDFQYKIGNFGPKQAFLGGIYGLFSSIIRSVQWSWSQYRLVWFVYRLLLVAVQCRRVCVFRERSSTQPCLGYRLIGTTGYWVYRHISIRLISLQGSTVQGLLVRRRISIGTYQICTAVIGPGQQDSSIIPALGFRFRLLCSRMQAI